MLALATGAPEALAGHVVRLLAALWRYLYVAAHHHEALTLHTAALAPAPFGTLQQGLAHEAVGTTLIMLGRYDETVSHFEQALTIGRIGSAAEPG
ncbi:hypothetical protein [Amycolatopsis sp. DG1A-15b]|uniref:hypothetical protein n=1 Tax=Amycolatopsis sp. DG1A-15b TaxID=3052846 RepID=UPI00255B65E4|nr:hypothetical protein [Amycolatopsis sp. DG1A-15b]WIX91353.1 hypothetical protein QRY02_13240 [Amycolatopsis sp. DG1A-15b]